MARAGCGWSWVGVFFTALTIAGAAIASERMDFSTVGYGGGASAPPEVPGRFAVSPSGGDDTGAIQAALDAVGRLKPDEDGFRGAVVLRPGTYFIRGQLRIRDSGIVLRGQEATLVAVGRSRRTLIEVRGEEDARRGPPLAVTDERVPAGGRRLTLSGVEGLAVGGRVAVRRPSTRAWIAALAMDKFKGPPSRFTTFASRRLDWWPGSRDVEWERTVVAVDAATGVIELDAPLTTALERRFGGGTVSALAWPGRLSKIGIENLVCVSEFDPANPVDEEHAWMCISLDRVQDAWVRQVTARHFAGCAIWVGAETRAVTVQDCSSEQPISELGGWRRLGFYVGGQQVLVERCQAEGGWRDFVTGHCAAGPNVFHDCLSRGAARDSGSFESWASGTLYDNVRIGGAALVLGNLGEQIQGAGWAAANSLAWNCSATSGVRTESPPDAPNAAVTDPAIPSLYREQLAARLGAVGGPFDIGSAAPSDPADLPAAAKPAPAAPAPLRRLALVDGRFAVDRRIVFGGTLESAMWQGQLMPARAGAFEPSPTRWAPGREGPGLTENLPDLADRMRRCDTPFFDVSPGLWYDRRRDEHSATRRPDADVWAPFLESPWARSGVGRAWDGLSKYDLTKFNPWYWDRIRAMARACAERGEVLVYHFYENHNLQEKAPHWVDFPWCEVNCLQATGIPTPAPSDGEMIYNVHVAEQFYDVSKPLLRELHRRHIWHGLDILADAPNVVVTLGDEFAGPLDFQRFFIDTVAQWEDARHRRIHLALETSKAVTDAVLQDPGRSGRVDVIDLRYWQYLPNGTLFAPDGGGRRAFRQIRAEAFGTNGDNAPPPGTPELVYRQVREYRDRYPAKALICGDAGQGPIPILMAGGSAVTTDYSREAPPGRDDRALIGFVCGLLSRELLSMNPNDQLVAGNAWCLANPAQNRLLIYSPAGSEIRPTGPGISGRYFATWFNPRSGQISRPAPVQGETLVKPSTGPWLVFLARQ
jgi:hypothetical protein